MLLEPRDANVCVWHTHTNTHTHLKTLKTLKTLKVAWVNRQGHFTVAFQKIVIVRYIYIYIGWHKARLRTYIKSLVFLDFKCLEIAMLIGF